MERIIAIIEARMGSTRLPGKSARDLAGKPLVQLVIERIRRAHTINDIVLATSTSPLDDALAQLAEEVGTAVHRGSETDVLGRILGAAHAAEATVHVQCWGDCPFVDSGEIDRAVRHLLHTGADLVGNGLGANRRLPYGLDVIAFRVGALEKAERETRGNAYHREHGTTYIYQNPALFRIGALETPDDLCYPGLNLTINTQDDYDFVNAIYESLYSREPGFGVRDVIRLVRETPTLIAHPNGAALGMGAS